DHLTLSVIQSVSDTFRHCSTPLSVKEENSLDKSRRFY
ncbi:Uncharacterized protein FWK35_00016642, partial [Aphis craccivora]